MLHQSLLRFWILGFTFLLIGPVRGQELPDLPHLLDELLPLYPSVQRMKHLVEAEEHRVSGSRKQPNPVLTLSGSAGDAQEDSNALVQTFEISGQPRLRHEQALARLESAEAHLRQARRDAAAELAAAWIEVWESRRLLALARLRSTLMQEMVHAAVRRYEVGEISQNEALRVELAEAEALAQRERAEADYRSAYQSLIVIRWQLGTAPLEEGVLEEFVLEERPELPELLRGPRLLEETESWSLEQVLNSVEDHFELAAMRAEQKAVGLDAELIGKETAPQLGFALYRSRFFGTGIEQGAQLSLSFPLFDWGRVSAQQRARQSEAQAQLLGIEEQALHFKREVVESWNRWQAALAVQEILGLQAERYAELARKSRVGYEVGLLSLTDVLQTETSFRLVGTELIAAQAEVYRRELELLNRTARPWPIELVEEL